MSNKKKDNIENEEQTINEEKFAEQENCAENTEETTENKEEAAELTEEEKLQAELAEANAKIDELKDKYLRQMADFDNYRKNAMKDKAELIKNGGERTISKILPVLDDFERAIATMEKSEDVSSIKEGVNLIFQKFLSTLKSEGLEKINTEGEEFNTDFHEAIAMIPAPSDDMKGKIIDCVQTGYKLNEKVIRHSKVAVGQ